MANIYASGALRKYLVAREAGASREELRALQRADEATRRTRVPQPRVMSRASRQREARELAAQARAAIAALGDDPPPLTRSQRIAEAAHLRRLAMARGK